MGHSDGDQGGRRCRRRTAHATWVGGLSVPQQWAVGRGVVQQRGGRQGAAACDCRCGGGAPRSWQSPCCPPRGSCARRAAGAYVPGPSEHFVYGMHAGKTDRIYCGRDQSGGGGEHGGRSKAASRIGLRAGGQAAPPPGRGAGGRFLCSGSVPRRAAAARRRGGARRGRGARPRPLQMLVGAIGGGRRGRGPGLITGAAAARPRGARESRSGAARQNDGRPHGQGRSGPIAHARWGLPAGPCGRT